jgi:16S rRNA (uracil1498-N3)-methyltransferase
MPRFYHQAPLNVDQVVSLDEDTHHHATRVLRLSVGDDVTLFNGQGGEYHGVLSHIDKRTSLVALHDFHADDRMPPTHITLVQGLSSQNNMDWTIEKATELGVSVIQPIVTEYVNHHLSGERLVKRQQHWQKLAIQSCCQSQRNLIPEITPLMTLVEWLAGHVRDAHADRQIWLLHPHRLSQSMAQITPRRGVPQVLMIGPEGGFSVQEIERMVALQLQPVTLGARILRTETAGIVGLSVLNGIMGF